MEALGLVPTCARGGSGLTSFGDGYLRNERISTFHITICLRGSFALNSSRRRANIDSFILDRVSRDFTPI